MTEPFPHAATRNASDLIIRPCRGFAELDTCVDIQVEVWGYDDRDIIPRRLFVVAQRIGGQIFGAFEPADQQTSSSGTLISGAMVGFAMALPAFPAGSAYLHSHMLAVKPKWRNAGVGRALKLAQRDEALARGIRKMEWTFDPLEIKNAYLNIARLGVVVRSYTPDFYGPTTSSLQAGLQSDRMHAEWYLDSDRVQSATEGVQSVPDKTIETVIVPAELALWKTSPHDRDKAIAVQLANRKVFLKAFQSGLAVIGFSRDQQGNGTYHLGESPIL